MFETIYIENFNAIKKMELELNQINILVGNMGSGKSTFFNALKIVTTLSGNPLISNGFFKEKDIVSKIKFKANDGDAEAWFSKGYRGNINKFHLKINLYDDIYKSERYNKIIIGVYDLDVIYKNILKTKNTDIDDKLEYDFNNIGQYLKYIERYYLNEYKDIVNTIRIIEPSFQSFKIKKNKFGVTFKDRDGIYEAQHLSKGLLQFIIFTIIINQTYIPSIIAMDNFNLPIECHEIMADMINSKKDTQFIITSHYNSFIDYFNIEDIINVKNCEYNRLKYDNYNEWLEEYTISELFIKNIIQGI